MKEIATELTRMATADQKMRWVWSNIRLDQKVDEATLERVKAEWLRVDGENLARLKAVFAEYGYPDKKRFEKKPVTTFGSWCNTATKSRSFNLRY